MLPADSNCLTGGKVKPRCVLMKAPSITHAVNLMKSFEDYVNRHGLHRYIITGCHSIDVLHRYQKMLDAMMRKFVHNAATLESVTKSGTSRTSEFKLMWCDMVNDMCTSFIHRTPVYLRTNMEECGFLTGQFDMDVVKATDNVLRITYAQYINWYRRIDCQVKKITADNVVGGDWSFLDIPPMPHRIGDAPMQHQFGRPPMVSRRVRDFLNSLWHRPDMSGGGAAFPLVDIRCVVMDYTTPMPPMDIIWPPPDGYYLVQNVNGVPHRTTRADLRSYWREGS